MPAEKATWYVFPVRRIGIVVKKNRPEALEILRELAVWIEGRGIEVFAEREVAEAVGLRGMPLEAFGEEADLVVVLGGDGTLLYAARALAGSPTPILGVNLGGLGFLTAVSREELFPTMERVLRGEFETEKRMMLRVRVESAPEREHYVLNDVVINKGALARIITITARVDGTYLTTFRGDGLIVSTPTGSTAYCLSAGGPIVHPGIPAIVLVPICPHTLTNRPLLVPDNALITLFHTSREEDVYLTLDGQVGLRLPQGVPVEVSKAPKGITFVRCPFRSYFDLLRTKLKWGGDLLETTPGGGPCWSPSG